MNIQYYKVTFPKMQCNFTKNVLSFTINQIKSRLPSVLYFTLTLYDMKDTEIYNYTSPRAVIGTVYDTYTHTIPEIDKDIISQCSKYQLEMYPLGIDSENPLYFTELMFQEGEFDVYHTPSEYIREHLVDLINNNYANLYDDEGNYLQVIRPNMEDFHTSTLDGAEVTILAPHFNDEEEIDNHISVFYEAMNQTDQVITVLR